jgi:hypothetical protein
MMSGLRRRIPGVLLLGAVLIPACSSDDEGLTPMGKFIEQYCSYLMPCCADAGVGTDPTKCKQTLGWFLGSATYVPQKGEECLAEIRAASSNGTVCPGSAMDDSKACEEAFISNEPGGTAKPGEACKDTEDCASAAEGTVSCLWGQDPETKAELRSCTNILPGKAGDSPCVGTRDGNVTSYTMWDSKAPTKGYLCDKQTDGLQCDYATQACKALGKPGDPCTYSDRDCVDAAWCDFATQLCEARVPAGSACEKSSSQCDAASYCNDQKQCEARAANGAPCTADKQCLSDECLNGKCEPATDLGTSMFCGS